MAREPSIHWLIFGAAVSPFLVNGWINAYIAGEPLWYWSFELLIWLLIPALACLLARRYGGPSLVALGYTGYVIDHRSLPGLLALCALAAVLAPAFYAVCERFAGTVFEGEAYFSYAEVIPEHGAARMLVIAWFALSAGVVEETLYRAYAWYLASRCTWPRLVYLTGAPLVFAVVHWEGGAASLLAAWFYGLGACVVYLGLRNLWPLIVGHCTTDLYAFS